MKSLADKEIEARQEDKEDVKMPDGGHLKEAVEKIRFLGPKTGWGFVAKESPYYSVAGKNLGVLQAGDLFKYSDVRQSARNDLLLAVVRHKGGWGEPCLLPCDAIAAYEGDPEKVNVQIVNDLREYFLILGRRDTRQDKLLQQEYQKNPFYGSYQQAAKEYNESVETATRMEQASEQLTGIRKTRANEELRELKYSQAALQVRLNEVALKYREWKAKNPADLSRLGDGQLDELNRELKTAKSKVANLVPDEEY